MRALAFVVCAGLLCACPSEPKPQPKPPAEEPAKPVDKKAEAPREVSPEEVPVETDFMAEVEQEITADNYGAALDEIAGELEKQ